MKKVFFTLAFLAFQFGFSQNSGTIKVTESKKIELTGELSKDKIDFYNQSFVKFVNALKISDKQAINILISDKVKDIVDDQMIQKLSGGISFDRKTAVYKSGNQQLLDKQTYPAIQYKYSDDLSDPPKDIITVIFENDGKILGVKPEYSK